MKRHKVTKNQTLRNLKVWWLLLSGTTSKVLTVLGLGVALFLIAVSTGTGTKTTTVNANQLSPADTESGANVPVLTLISSDDTDKPGIIAAENVKPASSEETQFSQKNSIATPVEAKIVVAQSTTQSELQKLVNQAMNNEAPAETVEKTDPPPNPTPGSNSTSDQLKAIINQAAPGTAPNNSYISTLNAEVETTVVIDDKTAQQPAASSSSSLSNSDRLKLIQDIAHTVAEDSSTTTENVDYVTVRENDSLWLIAKRVYNDPYQYNLLYQANKDILLNANSLVVGQQLRVPIFK